MIASDPLSLLRNLLNDPISAGPQFSDARLLSFLDEAQVQAVRETSSPEAYQVFSTRTIVTVSGTPTTGENFVLQINNVQISTPETTGQTLAQLMTLAAANANANGAINTVVQAQAVGGAIVFTCLGTGFTGNSATVSAVQEVHVTSVVSYVQEYQVYEQLLTHAVYCAGKLLTPSSPAILEGWNIGLWSQNPQGTTPFPGSGAVPGTNGQDAPAWVNAPPQVYPTNTGQEYNIKPTVQPYSNFYGNANTQLQAERYYWRSPGTIGLIPQPANLCQVVIYGVNLPPPIVSTAQTLLVPQSYRMFLVSYALWLARLSENTTNPGQQTLIDQAYQSYLRERAACLLKVRNAKGKIPRTFNSIPQRLSRSRYCVRRTGGRW